MPRLIEVGLLGPVTVCIDGGPPPPDFLWRKHLATALVLWTERPRPIARDRLLALLWADRPEQAARHSLNEALRVIRRVCGTAAVVSTPEAVSWVGPVTVDVDTWGRLTAGDPVNAAGLIRGAWCEGFVVPGAPSCEDWLDGERDRWRGRIVEVLVSAALLHIDRGQVDAAIEVAMRARSIHPWSDAVAAALIRARWLAGDRAGAIAAGHDHRKRIQAELGAVPAATVTDLLARLQAGAVPGALRIVTGAPPPQGELPPLLHRSELLSKAMASLRGARATGTGVCVAWSGVAGAGRTRLLDEGCARLRIDGVAVARLSAVPGDAQTPEAGLDALADVVLTSLPGVGGGDPLAIATLAARRPAWAERFPATDVGLGGGGMLTGESALLAVLRAAADEGPVVLAIDDIDRFHPDAVAAIVALVRGTMDHPVGWMVTVDAGAQQDGVVSLLRTIGRELPGIAVTVPPLDMALASDLVAWGLPDWEMTDRNRLARRLVAEADGSVFIAVALLGALRIGLQLPDGPTTWPPPDRTLDDTFPCAPPPALIFALRHAFHQLDVPHRRLLQRIAVGREPLPEAALHSGGAPDTVIEPMLDALEHAGWLASDRRGYRFAARAVRRFVVEDTLTPGQRRRLQDAGPGR